MPHQEIYLAALDQQSADAMSRLALLMHDDGLAASARKQAAAIRAALESEYHEPARSFYAFSRNADGTLDSTATIYPSVAWWTGRLALENAGPMLTRWASAEFSTDWGTRDLSDRTPFYDPISYHQGTVWPLFTGWVSLAEYRAGRSLAGYAHLMQNADLTWEQDLGSVTELLSGAFFRPMTRGTPHQIWSSAMVLTPALRGLFGLDWDALHRTLRIQPNLPASWESARLRRVPLGDARIDLEFTRESGRLTVRAHSDVPVTLCLVSQETQRDQDCRAPGATSHELILPLAPVELEMPHGFPLPGAAPAQLKAIGERWTVSSYEVDFEGPAGSAYQIPVRLNRSRVTVTGGEVFGAHLRFHIAEGSGFGRHTVSFRW
jgi:hypothetical protein